MKAEAEPTAAVLWTGGKDSALALYEAGQRGYRVQCLVTFAPPQPRFLAHPLDFIQLQAQALGLPHHVVPVTAPYVQSYEGGLRWLRDTLGVGCVVTGDIAEVNAQPNWIRERAGVAGIEVLTPLWGCDRLALLQRMLEVGLQIRISLVQTACLGEAWVGRRIDAEAVTELIAISADNGLDLCGENGEYHSLVTDGPMFKQPITLHTFARRSTDNMAYMNIQNAALASTERQ